MTAFAQPGGPGAELEETVRGLIYRAEFEAPRSQQKAIGPSEVGQACARRLAYQLLDMPKPDRGRGSPWYAVIGTAVHGWMAEALKTDNERLGRERWLVEQRVTVRPGLSGSCDAYDTDTRTVIDWKVVGNTSLNKYRSKGPRQEYVAQAHLYGIGWVNAGRQVDSVALVFLPRSQDLDQMHIWHSPFKPTVALGALERMDNVLTAAGKLDVESYPERWAMLPDDPSGCFFCPWRDQSLTAPCATGCPGAKFEAAKAA